MKKIFIFLIVSFLIGCNSSPVRDHARLNKKLDFKTSANSDGFESNTLFKVMNGVNDQKPTVILIHSCDGITPKNKNDLIRWKKLLMRESYNVLVMDHLSSRTSEYNCSGIKRPVTQSRMIADIYDAIEYLHKDIQVDKNKIFTLGFSLGAMSGASAASRSMYRYHGGGRPRPRAIAGLYGGCFYAGGAGRYLDFDTELPVLWLMGGDDKEAPVESCVDVNKKLSEKGLMSLHVYPDATHCWDCMDKDGFSKRAANGQYVSYKYNGAYTRDSERRVLEFFNSFK